METTDAKELLLTGLRETTGPEGSLGEMSAMLPELTEYLQELAAPGFVCAMVPIPPTPAVEYPGIDGLARAWKDWGGTFESVRAELDRIVEGPQSVAVLVRQIAVTKHGGVEIAQPSAMLWHFEDGLVTRLEFHLDQEAAFEAGGIPPASSA